MIADGSDMAWVRPTRRVHLALAVGMIVTGVILAVAGMAGGGHAAAASPAVGRGAGRVPGVVMPVAPVRPTRLGPSPSTPGASDRPHARTWWHVRHMAPATAPHH